MRCLNTVGTCRQGWQHHGSGLHNKVQPTVVSSWNSSAIMEASEAQSELQEGDEKWYKPRCDFYLKRFMVRVVHAAISITRS
jgi:hypothetical protein